MCPGLSYVRAISGSFTLFSTENKLLNLPAKKGFAIHHAARSWDEWRTQISVTVCLGFLMIIYFHFQSSKTHILSLLFLLPCFLMLVSVKTTDLFLLLLACCCLVTLPPIPPHFNPWPNQHKTEICWRLPLAVPRAISVGNGYNFMLFHTVFQTDYLQANAFYLNEITACVDIITTELFKIILIYNSVDL